MKSLGGVSTYRFDNEHLTSNYDVAEKTKGLALDSFSGRCWCKIDLLDFPARKMKVYYSNYKKNG